MYIIIIIFIVIIKEIQICVYIICYYCMVVCKKSAAAIGWTWTTRRSAVSVSIDKERETTHGQ